MGEPENPEGVEPGETDQRQNKSGQARYNTGAWTEHPKTMESETRKVQEKEDTAGAAIDEKRRRRRPIPGRRREQTARRRRGNVGYSITIKDPDTGETLHAVEKHPHIYGGTYAAGGTTKAWLYVTSNYSRVHEAFCGFTLKELNGKGVEEARTVLEKAAKILGTDRHEDYWAATPGNAGAALEDLLKLMDIFPEGVLRMDW